MKLFKPLLVASSVFVLAACGFTPSDEIPSNEPVIDLKSTDTQYAFATYTGIRMLEEVSVASAPQVLGRVDEETDPDEELAIVNRYLTLYKELTEEGVLNVAMAEVSDREEYAFQLTITTTDIDKVQSTFILYFNEVVIDGEDDIEDGIDDTGEDVLDDIPEGEENGENYRNREDPRSDDESTLLVGLAVIGDEEFAVRGYRLVEEDEVRFGFRASLDDGRVLRISHHSEDDVQKFQYFLRNGRDLIARKKVMIKVEDNQTMLKLEDVKDNVRSRYSFKQEVGEDGTYYKIRFDTPEGKGVIHIYVTLDGEGQEILEYYFSGGGTYHHDGNGNHNGEHSGNGNGHDDDDDKGHHGNPDRGEDEDYEEDFEDLDDF
jgi:hypothetical protein